MYIPERQLVNSLALTQRGFILREFAVRQDRLPRDQRIDLPEIQESYRVSFSDAVRVTSTEVERQVLQPPLVTGEGSLLATGLRLYRKNSGG
jgi:hypothetical protein